MKRYLPTIAVVIVLIGVLLYTRFFEPEKKLYPEIPLYQVAEQDVSEVEISSAGKKIRLTKGTDWQITEPESLPADPGKIASLLKTFSSFKAEARLADQVDALEPYGLDSPSLAVTVRTAGETHTLKFGKRTPVGGNLYLMEEGKPPLYTAPAFLAEQNRPDLEVFRKKIAESQP
ncbi:MAG: DUF4340 domain-containing protein [Deltaproteobacteria bacterium]|nr:DUF4340 domain-containing protein [Deltaproteobacteria bacterium]